MTIYARISSFPATTRPFTAAATGVMSALLAVLYLGCGGPHGRLVQKTGPQPSTSAAISAGGKDGTTAAAASVARTDSFPVLSAASQLLVKACDNYLAVNPENPKAVEVLTIKGSLFFNNKLYDSARAVYQRIISEHAESNYAFDAIRLIAQSFYEEKRFDEAGTWYKKLSEAAPDGVDKSEALARIAESIFRMAEVLESQSRFKDAAEQYERVALEYPDARIADVSLFNAGLAYEKQAEWSRAILVFQRLMAKYDQSNLLPKTQFRIAKCHEKLMQWDLAADTYLRLTAKFPKDALAPAALYNAGFCFENLEKWPESAATFEKMAQLFPQSDDAADVLFRAGELYGKIKDWESVSRVTRVFSTRFGNDESRIIQALCMDGIALYMRNRNEDAVDRLNNAVETYRKMKNPGTMNAYYAAKALYTIAEIHHTAMNTIALGHSRERYKKQLSDKSDRLEKAVDGYARVIKFNISEWTTRSIFQIGQAYEDFAVGIFSQDRQSGLPLDKQIAFELGIAQAVEKYFIEKAVYFHERNVKLAIQEKIEDKFILQSRQKLTYLPVIAAENYLALVEIARTAQHREQLDGFSLIARKLQLFQKIAPFQERAIALFLKCLELGTTYQEFNEYYQKASESITGISLSVGETYADVVSIARDAPIPDGFDDYERFVYKSKLLKQIEGYENQALENYLKTIKIAEAYKIDDRSVREAKERIGQLLFNRGWCYDLLCINAFNAPPYPHNIDEAEKEEYKARFEEIGLRYQEQAFDIYKNILTLSAQSYAAGDYVTHAYVRLYQNFPDIFGSREEHMTQTAISSGSQWRVQSDSTSQWFSLHFNDSSWYKAQRASILKKQIEGFPGNMPIPMWFGKGTPDTAATYRPYQTVFFRRTFTLDKIPHKATLFLATQGQLNVYVNGEYLLTDSMPSFPSNALSCDLMGKIRVGTNILAVKVTAADKFDRALFPLLLMTVGTDVPLPKPPGFERPLSPEEVRIDRYAFPQLKNFTLQPTEASR
ncbi:MAG: tetratricopeptide repeat protein [Chitinispirillaceae bacterium]|nr:tetratricopeptide repeat protein [Chitinispirillaceae bacterium]